MSIKNDYVPSALSKSNDKPNNVFLKKIYIFFLFHILTNCFLSFLSFELTNDKMAIGNDNVQNDNDDDMQ